MGPAFLPRLELPGVIEAHLMRAVIERAAVVLHEGQRRLPGRFEVPDLAGRIVFVPDAVPAATPRVRGTPVEVEYWNRGALCRFASRVHSFGRAGRVRLEWPAEVERRERRVSRRCAVDPSAGHRCRLCDAGEFVDCAIVDLSAGGLAFRYLTGSLALAPDDLLDAWIDLVGREPLLARFCVRHLRDLGDGWCIAGVRVDFLRSRDREALARAFADLEAALTGSA